MLTNPTMTLLFFFRSKTLFLLLGFGMGRKLKCRHNNRDVKTDLLRFPAPNNSIGFTTPKQIIKVVN